MTQAQKVFIERVGKAAAADFQLYGVLASLKIAQAILESGWGTSGLAVKANALFGIKATSAWKGRVFNTKTQECYDGVNFTTIDAAFRAYDSWEESIKDHSIFLTANARYAAVIGERDYKKAVRAIHAAGYATDPAYTDKLIKIIEQYKLFEFDAGAATPPAAENNGGKKMKITLDPGHGERGNPYPAAPGFFEGTQMWKLAQFMTAELEKRGFEIINTRPKITDNPTVDARGAMAARNGSVMFYSLHSNAPGSPSQTTVTGSEIFISVKGAQFRPFAEQLLNNICAVMGHNSRGVKTRPSESNPKNDYLGVLRSSANGGLLCTMLAEFGFHTNPKDAAFLTNDDNLRRLAAGQAEIIAAYFGAKPGTATTPAAQPAAPSTPPQPTPTTPAAFKVGDIVQFTGGGVYTSSTAHVPAHTRGASRCKVTQIAPPARNQYHLVSEDGGGVWGWVVSGDVKAIGTAPATFKEYTARVQGGATIRTGAGANFPAAGTIPAGGGVYTIVEESNGFGRLKSRAGWLSLGAVTKI